MKLKTVLYRYSVLYLPPLILGVVLVHIAVEGLAPALGGEIPKIRGVERMVLLAERPGEFWYEVSQRVFMLLMAPVVAVGWAYMRRSDVDSDAIIRGRFRRHDSLDKAVRSPLEP